MLGLLLNWDLNAGADFVSVVHVGGCYKSKHGDGDDGGGYAGESLEGWSAEPGGFEVLEVGTCVVAAGDVVAGVVVGWSLCAEDPADQW